MYIAMLSAEFPPRWGGMGSTVFHLSAALANRGHRVTVITRSGAGKPPDQEGGRDRSGMGEESLWSSPVPMVGGQFRVGETE